MNFIEAVIKISQTDGFEFCDDEEELQGLRDICVFLQGEFVGKLRWPDKDNSRATVDEELIRALQS